MDELRAYADRRLELGDMIRAALHLARGSGDEQAEVRARDLLARLAAGTFQLTPAAARSPPCAAGGAGRLPRQAGHNGHEHLFGPAVSAGADPQPAGLLPP
jgi:hypothetical protein